MLFPSIISDNLYKYIAYCCNGGNVRFNETSGFLPKLRLNVENMVMMEMQRYPLHSLQQM